MLQFVKCELGVSCRAEKSCSFNANAWLVIAVIKFRRGLAAIEMQFLCGGVPPPQVAIR